MKISKIKINTKTKNYSIIIGRNLINQINKILNNNNLSFEKCLIVNDKNVPTKYKSLLKKNSNQKKFSKLN